MAFDWFKNKKEKDNKKSKRLRGKSTRITNDIASNERVKIDVSNIASEEQDRGTGAYTSNLRKRNLFEKDELAEVRRQLELKEHVLSELIGTGSYADVYRGMNNGTGRDVAIKIIKLCDANRHYQETFLQTEIDVIQQLNHRRIIKLYFIFQIDNKVCMVMEYAERGTLSDLISKRGALREVAAWALFKEMHRGLTYMHRNMVAHRDLKVSPVHHCCVP